MLTPMPQYFATASGVHPESASPAAGGGSFHTTRWTQVITAKEASREGRDALRDLCAAYYAPVITYLRRHGHAADAAQELAHEFFARMLEGDSIRAANPMQGRFRSYVLGAVKHFLAHRREAALRLRRGAGMSPVALDSRSDSGVTTPGFILVDEDGLSPDAAFDRQWALTVLDRAMESLRRESRAEGKEEMFEKLHPWLTGQAEHGEQAELAAALHMNMNSLKSAVHRLKHRFRSLVREEIAATLEDPSIAEEEMSVLFIALKRR